jgi:hypothetical protein
LPLGTENSPVTLSDTSISFTGIISLENGDPSDLITAPHTIAAVNRSGKIYYVRDSGIEDQNISMSNNNYELQTEVMGIHKYEK